MNISDFQKNIDATFGKRDRKRGLEKCFLWFVEEVGELSEALRKGDRKSAEHEIGDVFAWLVSVANVANIDVEKTVKRFSERCPYCRSKPCACKNG